MHWYRAAVLSTVMSSARNHNIKSSNYKSSSPSNAHSYDVSQVFVSIFFFCSGGNQVHFIALKYNFDVFLLYLTALVTFQVRKKTNNDFLKLKSNSKSKSYFRNVK